MSHFTNSRGITLLELALCLAVSAIAMLGLSHSYRYLMIASHNLQQQSLDLQHMIILLESYPFDNSVSQMSKVQLKIEPATKGCVILSVTHPDYQITLTRWWCKPRVSSE